MWRSLRARGRGVRERVLTYAEERAVGGLERKEWSQASLMRWNKKDFLSKSFENNCLFLVAFLTSLSPLTLISPLTSLLGTLVNVNSYFLIQLGTICLTSPLALPPGPGLAFCVILCVHLRFSWLLFMSVYFSHAFYIPLASLSFPFRA